MFLLFNVFSVVLSIKSYNYYSAEPLTTKWLWS